MNTVWYSSFATGPDSVSPKDFVKPSWVCIPVGAAALREFFEHEVTHAHVFDAAFHERAHFLPHATPSKKDLSRAQQVRPRAALLGDSFGDAMRKLNSVLKADRKLETRPCTGFNVTELQRVQTVLFAARAPALQKVYNAVRDTRSIVHKSRDELEAAHNQQAQRIATSPELNQMVRDGLCHETVMWYIHHLSASAREELKELVTMPLLPERAHAKPANATPSAAQAHKEYTNSVSCAVCHVQ